MQHLIQKQTIDLKTADDSQARIVQERVHGMFTSRTLSMMDKVLSSFSPEQTHILIEKLDIDLGTLSGQGLERQFNDRLKERLVQALEKELPRLHATGASTIHGQEFPTIREMTDIDTLLYFLEHGVLPWWSAGSATADLEALMNRLLENQGDALVAELRKSPLLVMVERLIKQFSSQTFLIIIKAIEGVYPETGQTLSALLNLSHSPLIPEQIEMQIRSRLLYEVLKAQQSDISTGQISETLYQIFFEASSKPGTEALSFISDAQQRLPSTDRFYQWLENKKECLVSAMPKDENSFLTGKGSDDKKAGDSRTGKTVDLSSAPVEKESAATKPLKVSSPAGTAGTTPETAEQIQGRHSPLMDTEKESEWKNPDSFYYIENAGLILLWPFLVQYLKVLNLVKDKQFVSETAREKAVFLLQYLVAGLPFPHEHVLFLNKLLCGWPFKAPLLRSIDICPADKRESEKVIQSAINHWKALKKTSIDGFRQSFLKREGRFMQAGNHWELTVGRRGMDVLLDQLPWGIGVIRLPWMRQEVYVEW